MGVYRHGGLKIEISAALRANRAFGYLVLFIRKILIYSSVLTLRQLRHLNNGKRIISGGAVDAMLGSSRHTRGKCNSGQNEKKETKNTG